MIQSLSIASASPQLYQGSKPTEQTLVAACLERALHRPAKEFSDRGGKRIRSQIIDIAHHIGSGPLSFRSGVCPHHLLDFIELLHAGSLAIDDIQDDSPTRRGCQSMHVKHGVPLAINTGNWMYFAALEKLTNLPSCEQHQGTLMQKALAVIKRCHEGQALDLSLQFHQVPQDSVLNVVEKISEWKTGALTELAAWLGAMVSGASIQVCQAVSDFGKNVGIALQMQNDFGELRKTARGECFSDDLRLRRVTWPWAWLSVSLPEKKYRNLIQIASDQSTSQINLAIQMTESIEIMAESEINLKLKEAAGCVDYFIEQSAAGDKLNLLLAKLESRNV